MHDSPATGPDLDDSARLLDAVRNALRSNSSLYLCGGNSKRIRFGRHCEATPLDVSTHRGVVSYRPEEMVLTARAGTPIHELRALTAQHGQQLPFEPAELQGKATIGGCLATGSSGPARPWLGSTRDAVLGIRLISGRGEHLRFGGEVIKNVAGYDVSRLQAGALGTLGLISEVSFKVSPLPQSSLYLQRTLDASESITAMRELALKPWPITGLFWRSNTLHLRLQGSSAALSALRPLLGEFEESDAQPWIALREWSFEELQVKSDENASRPPLGCVDMAAGTPVDQSAIPVLIDWGGARRYFRSEHCRSAEALQDLASRSNGQAMRLGLGNTDTDVLSTPVAVLKNLHLRIKAALDPQSVFNPGRLYRWMH